MSEIDREEINELIEIMKTSMNLEKIKECIKAILHLLLTPTTKTIFINRYYYSVGKIVTHSILDNWLYCLNDEVKEELCDFFIKEPKCYILSILLLCKYLKEKSSNERSKKSPIISSFVLSILTKLLTRNNLKLILIELSENNIEKYIDFDLSIQLLKSLPDRISNYYLKEVVVCLQSNNYYYNLLSGYFDGLMSNEIKTNNVIISILRDLDNNNLSIFVKLLNDIYIISLNNNENKTKLLKDFNSYPLNLRIKIFKIICKSSSINFELFLCLFKKTIENEMEYKSIINIILLNISLHSKKLKILIKYLKSINDCLILTLLDEILPKWSKDEFILRNEKSIEKCVCVIIDKCLECMTKSDLEMSNNSNRLLYLMDGIQHLLSSNNEYCKRYGEYLSNKLFKIVDKEHKPIECDGFSDNEEEEEENENNNKYHYTNPEIKKENVIKNEKIENVNNNNNNIYENPLLIIDPIEYNTYIEYELLMKENDNDNSNESDSDSDSLESYDLIEKENKMVGKEKYLNNIGDIIDGLKDEENIDKRDVSLLSLDKLLKSHPIGIEKYGLKLCIILLNIRNAYFFENFEEIRNRNVIRIISLVPLETVPFLIKEFYSLEKDLEYRIMILKMLSESAKLLCDVKNEEESENINKKEDIKRIGKIIKEFKKVKKPKIIKNKFLEYSDIYLIPLMNGIDHKNRQIDLLNKDGYLLSKLLYCIGIIYECCYNSIKIIEYNVILLKIIFICRYHQDNNVRISILYLLSRLVLVTPKSILESYFINELSELSSWLLELSKNDIDPICREYSSIILNSGYFLSNNSINI